ncbi:MAG: hypothetical protein ACLFNU_09650 [Bacteroidales bacterium]
MHNRIIFKNIVLLTIPLLFVGICNFAYSQDDKLSKEVQVVRPYEPTISDAFKLNQLPLVKDTARIVPTFAYNLTARPVKLDLPVKPIPAARMVAEPLSRVSKGYVKAGFGNYVSPLAEVYFANERSEEYSYGGWVKHRSSFGDIKLDNDDKADASFQKNRIGLFGKKIFDKSVLSGEGNFSSHSYSFYGYDTTSNYAPQPDAPKEQLQQILDVSASFYSTHSDSAHLNYNLSTRFASITDKHSMQQSTFVLKSNFDRYFNVEKFGGDIAFTHHMSSDNLGAGNSSIIGVAPWIGLFGKQWRVKAGINATFDINSIEKQYHFYPVGQISFDIVSNYVIPYFQFDGYIEDNSYAKILFENPWVEPGLNVWNTSHKFIMKGGVKGNFSPKVAYNLSASFSLVDSAYFYVNTPNVTDGFLENRFIVEHDNIRLRTFQGELTMAPTNSIKLFLQGEYNIYTMNFIEKPWHKPLFAGRFTASYTIQDKILLKANFFIEGERYIKSSDGTPQKIDGIADVNLGIEYRYTSRVSAFLDLNNLTGNRYHLWYLYPAQQFNMMLGLTYAF